MQLHPVSHYAHELRRDLPASAFAPAHSRLAWLPLHLAIIALATTSIAAGWVGWPIALLLGCGVCGVFAVLYHFLFLFWIGGTPGFYVARLASDALNGASRETDERPRFR